LRGRIKLAYSKQLAEEDKTEKPNAEINNDTVELNDKIINISKIMNLCRAQMEINSGAHKCYICKKDVHAINGCSVASGEEGCNGSSFFGGGCRTELPERLVGRRVRKSRDTESELF